MNIKLTGINILWYPTVWLLWGIFGWFTPAYWEFVWKITDTTAPMLLKIAIVGIVLLLSVVLYLVLTILACAIALALTIITAIVWFGAAVLNGIFHFTSWTCIINDNLMPFGKLPV